MPRWLSALILVGCAAHPPPVETADPPLATPSARDLALFAFVSSGEWSNDQCEHFPSRHVFCEGARLGADGAYLVIGQTSCIGSDSFTGRYAFHALDADRFVVVLERRGVISGRRVGEELELGGLRLQRRPGPRLPAPTALPPEVAPPLLVAALGGPIWRATVRGVMWPDALTFLPEAGLEVQADGCTYRSHFSIWPSDPGRVILYLRDWPCNEASGLHSLGTDVSFEPGRLVFAARHAIYDAARE